MSTKDEKGGDERSQPVGYGAPPRSTRFRKGKSGNPKGRPKNRHRQPPFEAVLGQKVTIREGGETRRVSAAEAFLQQMTKRGLEGNGPAARDLLDAIEVRRGQVASAEDTITFRTIYVAPGSVNPALEPLGMARTLDRSRPSARMALEPWLVEAALARFGARQLTREEQQVVVEATRTPRKVRWPEWWSVRPWQDVE